MLVMRMCVFFDVATLRETIKKAGEDSFARNGNKKIRYFNEAHSN